MTQSNNKRIRKENNELKHELAKKERWRNKQYHEKDQEIKELKEKNGKLNHHVFSLEKELEEKETLIERLESRIEESEAEASCHLDALEVAEKWKILQQQLLRDELAKAHDRRVLLRKIESENQQLKELYLNVKTLPSLPKKQSKFKQLGIKVKTKFQQLIERGKNQDLIARIEVKTE